MVNNPMHRISVILIFKRIEQKSKNKKRFRKKREQRRGKNHLKNKKRILFEYMIYNI